MRTKFFLMTSALAAVIASPAVAAVTVVGNTPSSFTVDFDGNIAQTPVAGLTASMLINFLNTTNGGLTYNFSYTLTNTSTAPITNSRVSGFAFDTTPNIVSATASGIFNNAILPASLPNGVGNVEVCFNAANNCQGGGNGGVAYASTSALSNFSVTLASPATSLTFDQFYVRYQSIEGSNLGNSGTGMQVQQQPVPEPGTWAMLVLGFGIAGSAVRRRRNRLAIA